MSEGGWQFCGSFEYQDARAGRACGRAMMLLSDRNATRSSWTHYLPVPPTAQRYRGPTAASCGGIACQPLDLAVGFVASEEARRSLMKYHNDRKANGELESPC